MRSPLTPRRRAVAAAAVDDGCTPNKSSRNASIHPTPWPPIGREQRSRSAPAGSVWSEPQVAHRRAPVVRKQQPGRALGQSCLPACAVQCARDICSNKSTIIPPRCRRRNLAVAAAAASRVRLRRCRNFIFPPILKPRVGRDADDTVATFLTHAALRFRDCCGVGDRTGQAGRRA
jgi:hypothetical protein